MKPSENLFIFNKFLNMLLFLILNKIKVGIVRNALKVPSWLNITTTVMFTRSADRHKHKHAQTLSHAHPCCINHICTHTAEVEQYVLFKC